MTIVQLLQQNPGLTLNLRRDGQYHWTVEVHEVRGASALGSGDTFDAAFDEVCSNWQIGQAITKRIKEAQQTEEHPLTTLLNAFPDETE